jgi:ABC-type molybdate transport system permease subunit
LRVEQELASGAWFALSPQEWTAIALSLKVATIGSLASLPFGVAMAWPAAVMGFPLMVRAIRLSIEAVDARLEQAAES